MKDRIKQKAHDLFMQYGVRSITMDEIALQMGASKKTIYQFFADKDELVEAVIIDMLNQNQVKCNQDRNGAKDAVHEVFLAIDMMQEMFQDMNPIVLYELERYYPKAFEKFKQHKFLFLYKVMQENIERGITEELYRIDIDVEVHVKARLESMMMPFNQLIFPKSKFSLIKVETELTIHFIYGLATIKGHKLITKYLQVRKNNKKTNTNEKIMAS